jgi:hypothetical protein
MENTADAQKYGTTIYRQTERRIYSVIWRK